MFLIKVLLFFCYCVASQSMLLSLSTISLLKSMNKRTISHSHTKDSKRLKYSKSDKKFSKNKKKQIKKNPLEKVFLTKDSLSEQQSISPKKKICDQCHREFKTVLGLKNHKDEYKSRDHYPCDQCVKVFLIKDALSEHQSIIHSEKKICDQCHREFKTAWGLKKHKDKYRDREHYACDQCHNILCSQETLRKHQSKVHKNSLSAEKYIIKCGYCRNEFPSLIFVSEDDIQDKKKREEFCESCKTTFESLGISPPVKNSFVYEAQSNMDRSDSDAQRKYDSVIPNQEKMQSYC